MTLTHKVMDTGPLGMGLVFLQNLSNTYGSFLWCFAGCRHVFRWELLVQLTSTYSKCLDERFDLCYSLFFATGFIVVPHQGMYFCGQYGVNWNLAKCAIQT